VPRSPFLAQTEKDQLFPSPVQGPVFTTAAFGETTCLLAANGHEVLAVALQIQSVSVVNTLASDGGLPKASQQTPAVNKLLNYFHSACRRFPVDDCISLSQAKRQGRAGVTRRVVKLHHCTGAQWFG
jgi:hypothetical protein